VAWVKLDDKFRVHPKILALSPVAGWLWVCGLSYCNDHLTDGAIPSRGLPGVAPTIKNPLRYVEELVRVGLWTVAETGWLVHDYHQYQPTRSDAISDGALKMAAKVAGGLARSKFAERASGKFAKTHTSHQQSTSSAPAEPPAEPPAGHQQATSPVPVPVPEEESKTLSRSRATRRLNGFSEESKAVLQWLNDKAGKNFQPVDAHLRFIEARLKDHEPWVLRKVVTVKVQEWNGDKKSRVWLRPKTLFNETNFANYVGDLPAFEGTNDGR
jgi:uncharacterized phage protein (TIGR02220 family)